MIKLLFDVTFISSIFGLDFKKSYKSFFACKFYVDREINEYKNFSFIINYKFCQVSFCNNNDEKN